MREAIMKRAEALGISHADLVAQLGFDPLAVEVQPEHYRALSRVLKTAAAYWVDFGAEVQGE